MSFPDELLRRARGIALVLFDVDGVMTDGRLYYSDEGIEIKAFHSQDGLGIKRLMSSGVLVGVITGRDTPAVTRRMADLGIELLVQGCSEKAAAAERIMAELGVAPQAMCFIGDDIIDVPAMQLAGLAVTVPNAHISAREAAHWITPRAGGQGAARDLCDLLLEARQ